MLRRSIKPGASFCSAMAGAVDSIVTRGFVDGPLDEPSFDANPPNDPKRRPGLENHPHLPRLGGGRCSRGLSVEVCQKGSAECRG